MAPTQGPAPQGGLSCPCGAIHLLPSPARRRVWAPAPAIFMRTQQHASDFYVGAALVAARPLRLTAAFSRTSRRPAGGCGPPPLHPGVGAPRFRGPRANPAKRFAWGKGGPAAGVSVRACPEANDPKLGPTLSRCGGCATPHCLPLREKHLAPAAQLLFRLRGALCGCDPRLRASCHAAGWAHDRVAKRPFREKCRWASPSLFFRLHVLLAPLCAYPPRFLRSGAWR